MGGEVEIEVKGIKGRKTWSRSRLDSTDLIKTPVSFGSGVCPFLFFPLLCP